MAMMGTSLRAYRRIPELVGFQWWAGGAYDKRVSWRDWQAANYQPRHIRERQPHVMEAVIA